MTITRDLAQAAFDFRRAHGRPPTKIDMGASVGDALADEGAKIAADKAERLDPGWIAAAERVAVLIAERDGEVSSEAMKAACPPPEGSDPRAIGHVFRNLSRAGRLEFVRYRKAECASRHSGPVAVWKLAEPRPG